MIDETDISQEKNQFYEQRAQIAVKNLQKKNINAQYVASREEALTAVLEMIPPGAVVARGDSITIEQIGIISELEKRRQNKLIYPLERDADGHFLNTESKKRKELARAVFSADIYCVLRNNRR